MDVFSTRIPDTFVPCMASKVRNSCKQSDGLRLTVANYRHGSDGDRQTRLLICLFDRYRINLSMAVPVHFNSAPAYKINHTIKNCL